MRRICLTIAPLLLVACIAAAGLLGSPSAAEAASFSAHLKTPKAQPKAGKLWRITVTARSKNRRPLTATAYYQFLFNGQVVSTQYPDPKAKGKPSRRKSPYRFHGRYSDDLLFPARAVGIKLTLRVVVSVRGKGTVHLDKRVRVRK